MQDNIWLTNKISYKKSLRGSTFSTPTPVLLAASERLRASNKSTPVFSQNSHAEVNYDVVKKLSVATKIEPKDSQCQPIQESAQSLEETKFEIIKKSKISFLPKKKSS